MCVLNRSPKCNTKGRQGRLRSSCAEETSGTVPRRNANFPVVSDTDHLRKQKDSSKINTRKHDSRRTPKTPNNNHKVWSSRKFPGKNQGCLHVHALAPRRNADCPVESDTDHLRQQTKPRKKHMKNKTRGNRKRYIEQTKQT